MIKTLINFGLFLFICFSALLIYIYISLLIEKIQRPTFKNLDSESFIWIGGVMLIFIIVDILILKHFSGLLKKKD